MKKHTSVVVREALNDWTELLHLEQELSQLAASEGAFSRRLLFQYAVEAAAAGDEQAEKLLAAMGRTHARTQRELQRALSIAAEDRRAKRRPRQPPPRRPASEESMMAAPVSVEWVGLEKLLRQPLRPSGPRQRRVLVGSSRGGAL